MIKEYLKKGTKYNLHDVLENYTCVNSMILETGFDW